MKLPNLYSEVGWNREIIRPYVCNQTWGLFVVFFPVFLLTATIEN
ncbi:hypothetical protein [Enterococcus faecium]|nr:hypothetical protein [Enterococcus faecium]EPI17540.1 hypothetical protein D355_00632 [Enterococcus faecium SD1C-2]MDK4377312.1 hypothetical protein [Enterococcus faecium]